MDKAVLQNCKTQQMPFFESADSFPLTSALRLLSSSEIHWRFTLLFHLPACEQSLSSLEANRVQFEKYKNRLKLVREDKEKRKLDILGEYNGRCEVNSLILELQKNNFINFIFQKTDMMTNQMLIYFRIHQA